LETTACVQAVITYIEKVSPIAVASYLATGSELDLHLVHDYLWAAGQAVWLPRVIDAQQLSWHPVMHPAHLVAGRFGIQEPDPAFHPAQTLSAAALVLVPGIAFTADGQRLGQGQGYYDRALEYHRGIVLGLGFSCQHCDALPSEAHDRRLDGLILGGEFLLIPP
jgi:5-formyltetrahydrofolate cyclo-ligase